MYMRESLFSFYQDEKFFIVVQRRVFLQSSDDVINWFVCNTDFGSIFGLSIGLR